MVALPNPQSRTVEAIYRSYELRDQHDERSYLGMSVLGEECERRLWYGFRWAHAAETFNGRKLRLFDTGHREEARLIEDLRAIGCVVHDVDQETRLQWSVETANGHAKGHLDGVVEGIPDAPKTPHVFEAKTHSAKSFRELVRAGVRIAKPMHYAQMQAYMHLTGLTRALYLAVEKDTDTIHGERIEYDAEFSLRLMAKAARIISSDRAPAKLHDDPTSKAAWACAYCPAFAVCHAGEFARTNCRTCLHASPGHAGSWHCARFGRELSLDDQRAGCPAHLYLPDLVPGEQVDVSPTDETVTYRLRDGRAWVDGRGAEGVAA